MFSSPLEQIANAISGAVYQYKRDRRGRESFLFISEGIRKLYGFSPEQVMANPELIWQFLTPRTRSRVQASFESSATTLAPWQCEFEVNLPDGQNKWVKGESIPREVEDGIIWDGILVDITQQKWQEQLLATQQAILENLAKGKDLEVVLTQLIKLIEQQTQHLTASVLLLEGDRLWHYGQSQLPAEYLNLINGMKIGEGKGSCGTAVARGEPVISIDIENDSLWENVRDIAQTYNFKSCWSFPIFSSKQTVLGTFALYSSVSREPNRWEQDLINIATKLATLAVEQKQQEYALRKQAQQEQLLSQITGQIRRSLNLDTILANAVEEIHRSFQTDRVLIYSVNYTPGKIIAETVGDNWTSLKSQNFYDPCLQSLPLTHIDANDLIQNISDVNRQYHLHSCYAEMLRENEVKANLAVPIFQDHQIWGFLIAQQCSHPRRWQQDEIYILQKLSEQLAIAIQQAELYQQTQLELQEREKLANQLHHEAMHDALTQLPNRNLLMDRLQHIFQLYQRRSTQNHSRFALLFLDLNRFKIINDTLGHDAGDQLLITVAERLQNCLRDMDTISRLGGDEFVIILEGIDCQQDAMEVANRIHEAFALPAYLYGQQIYLNTSIGIVMDSPRYVYPEEMLRDADVAMYEAKKNQLKYVVFDPAMQICVSETLQLEAELREAWDNDEFVLYYQPIFDLESGQIKGLEAFTYWRHPERGLIPSIELIPIAEQAGAIDEIELWSLQEACSRFKEWQTHFQALQNASIYIKVSANHVYNLEFANEVIKKLQTSDLDSQFLKLEITETILIEKQNLAGQILEKLEKLGIKICLNHFGVGYCSLNYLHRFPIHELKLDPSIIANIDQSNASSKTWKIVKAIANLSRDLNLNPIAQEVETEEQRMILRSCGYQSAQGSFFCPPLSTQQMATFLASTRNSEPPT